MDELQFINYWIYSKDTTFLAKHNIDISFFIVHADVVEWITDYINKYNVLPTHQAVKGRFDSYEELTGMDALNFVIDSLKESKAFVSMRLTLEKGAALINDKKTLEAASLMYSELGQIVQGCSSKLIEHDWVKDALARFNIYMENHGKEFVGYPFGIDKLDEVTGGIVDEDFIVLYARLNEGKSLASSYIAYNVWRYTIAQNIKRPTVYFSTEMPYLEVAYRLDTFRSHFSNRELNEGKLVNPTDYSEYLKELSEKDNSFIVLTQEAVGGRSFTPQDVENVILSKNPALVVIDQLYDFTSVPAERTERERIVSVTEALRRINLNTKTPVLVVTQALRKAAEEGRKKQDATPEADQVQGSDKPMQKATKALALRLLSSGEVMKVTVRKSRGAKKDVDIYMHTDLDRGIWTELDETECHM